MGGQPAPPAKKTGGKPPRKRTASGGSLPSVGAREPFSPESRNAAGRRARGTRPQQEPTTQASLHPAGPRLSCPQKLWQDAAELARAELQQEVRPGSPLLPARLGCSSPAQRQQGSEGTGGNPVSPLPTNQQPAAQPKKNVLWLLRKHHQQGPARPSWHRTKQTEITAGRPLKMNCQLEPQPTKTGQGLRASPKQGWTAGKDERLK